MATLASDLLTHFELLLKNGWIYRYQTCHTRSLWGPDQELLLFKLIWNPIWPPWPLIYWHILNLFSRTSEGIDSKLAKNVLYEILTMCCFFLSRSEIHCGRRCFWLADTFWTSSQERTKGIYTKLATHVPYKVPTKCCYFLSRSEIQYGCPGLWFADTFWTSSQERPKGSTPNLPQMFLMRF